MLATPVALVDLALQPEALRRARRLGLHVAPCRSGQHVVEGVPSSPVARGLVLDALGLAEADVFWTVALDAREPSIAAVRARVRAAAVRIESPVDDPATVLALFPSAAEAAGALCP